MIILDTSVVSEPLGPTAEPAVLAWLDQQDVDTLYLTTISLAELRHGIAALPEGRRKERLATALDPSILPLFGPRVLAFDVSAAQAYARLRARAKATGSAIGVADAYIAAVASVHGFKIATRDTGPFEAARNARGQSMDGRC